MRRWIVGTSGFSYAGWRGVFYPPELPAREWLAYYAREFPAVELNVTFYRTPRESTFRSWADQVPARFRFVLKAPRVISHIRRLAGCGESLRLFHERADLLGAKLAAVLLQLPPSLAFDAGRLDAFLDELPAGFPAIAWEPRHRSWAAPAALDHLRRRRQAIVVADSGGRYPTITAFTAPPAYLRFHGPAGLYATPYGDAQLAEYVAWVEEGVPARQPVWAFFNNDVGGHAIANARQLLALTRR